MAQVDDISIELKQKYFLKSKGQGESKVRVAKEIRDRVHFAYLNLMDDSYHLKGDFNVIFLRNTLIYFEPAVQIRVLNKVLERLVDGGFLFIGHSESLINMNLPIQSIAPSVYVKKK
jgi:chemotaxis protein methyltransferase CheR